MVLLLVVRVPTATETPTSDWLLPMMMQVPIGLRSVRQDQSRRPNTPQLQAAALQAVVLSFS
jgi:hypothetical protein